jgi:DNA-binding beta-propeller fold protein YncE
VFVDSAGDYALVTDLETASVSLLETRGGEPATIADVAENIFTADATTGIVGATAVQGRTPNMPDDIIYVGSLSEGMLQTYTVGVPVDAADWYLIEGSQLFLDSVGFNAGASEDTRAIKFSSDGSTLYLVNRLPASLQVFDTSIGPAGAPNNLPLGGTPVCRDASQMQVLDSGDGDRIYISCFEDGTVWVLDPRNGISVDDVINAGSGPYALAVAPTRNKL